MNIRLAPFLFLPIALAIGCAEQEPADGALDIDDPAEEPDARLYAPPAERPSVTLTPTQEPCGVIASLSLSTMDIDNDTTHAVATVEEEQDAAGLLSSQTLRWLDQAGVVRQERVALISPAQCLGLLTLKKFNEDGQITEERVEVVDPNFVGSIMAYVIVVSTTRRWTYDAEGREIHVQSDFDFDGTFDHHIWSAYDDEGRLVRRENTLEGLDPDSLIGTLGWGAEALLETWTYDARGNTLVETAEHPRWSRRIEQTFDAQDRLLTLRRFESGALAEDTARTWRPDGQPLTLRTHNPQYQDTQVTWFYTDEGTLARVDSFEDFGADGLFDRLNREHFDTRGLRTLYEQDQPFDGRIDWRERARFDEAGRMIWAQSVNEAEGAVVSEIRWTFNDAGLEIAEAVVVRGWQGMHALKSTDYDPAGNPLRVAWTDERGQLLREHRFNYDDAGRLLTEAHDQDGDGDDDLSHAQTWDRGGNLLLDTWDHDGDGIADRLHFLHYAPF